MTASYPHLPLQREEPITEKRSGNYFPQKPPDDPAAHGQYLRKELQKTIAQTESDIDGFDKRKLFRFQAELLRDILC